MKVLVLGSAAHGPYLRWACGCPGCLRAGPLGKRAHARTRSTIAVSVDGRCWALVNASTDIGVQMCTLASCIGPSDTASIGALVLTSADIDCAGGLLSLRDGPALDVYATAGVFEDLTGGLPLLPVLELYRGVRWHLLAVTGNEPCFAFEIAALAPLRFEAIALPGFAPPYSAHRNAPSPGDRIALRVFDPATDRRLVYAPGSGLPADEAGADGLSERDCLLLDGSAGAAPARDATIAAAPGGARRIRRPAHARGPRKVLLHLRSGDPLLDATSEERQWLQRRGIEVGYDGMEIVL